MVVVVAEQHNCVCFHNRNISTHTSWAWLLKYEEEREVCSAFRFMKMICQCFYINQDASRCRAKKKSKRKGSPQHFLLLLIARKTVTTTVHILSLIIPMPLTGIEKIAVISTQTCAVPFHVKVNREETHPLFCLPCFSSHQTNTASWF